MLTLREVSAAWQSNRIVTHNGKLVRVVGFAGPDADSPDGFVDVVPVADPVRVSPKELNALPKELSRC